MKKRMLAISIVVVMLVTCLPIGAAAVEANTKDTYLYVSPNGNDETGSGTESKPFATIQKARDVVRTLNDNMNGNIHVVIADGTYVVTETIEFNAKDSATNGYRIIYEAAAGAKPVISGGYTVTDWTVHDTENMIYKARVPGGMNFRQLYVNGQKATRARNTAAGIGEDSYLYIADVDPMDRPNGSSHVTNSSLYINASEIPSDMTLSELEGAEIHEVISWTGNVLRIREATQETGSGRIKLTLEEPESNLIFNRPFPWIGNFYGVNNGHYPYYLENAYALMDTDGEWYLDRSDNTLYYKAPVGTDMAATSVVAPAVETLLDVQGELDDPVVGLSIEGLTFEHSNWTYPSDNGFVDSQDGHPVVSSNLKNEIGIIRASAGVHVACTNGFRFEGNTLTHIGNMTALDIEYGTINSVVKNNTITNVAGNGIMVAKFTQDPGDEYHLTYSPDDVREICDGDKILNNIVLYTGMEYEGTCGIVAGYPRNLTIANNEVGYCPYTGISVGYGWTHEDNPMCGNIIARNNIHHYMQRANDGAGIYTLSKQPASYIIENYIHDSGPYSHTHAGPYGAIYTDEQTDGYTIARNVSATHGHNNNSQLANNLILVDNLFAVDVSSNPTAQEIASAAGPQDYLNSTDEILPLVPIVTGAVVKGNLVEIQGAFMSGVFMSADTVVFSGSDKDIEVTEFLQQTTNSILCAIPDGAVAGPVYVKSGTKESNKDIILATNYSMQEVVNEPFTSYDIAELQNSEVWTKGPGGSAPQVETADGNQYLNVSTNNVNSGIRTTQSYTVSKVQFDFCFAQDSTSYEGLYIYSKDGDELAICPAWGASVRLNRGGSASANPTIIAGTWYTCVLSYEGQDTRVKIWQQGSAEPTEATITMRGTGDTTASPVRFEYYAMSGKSAYFDNILICVNGVPTLEMSGLKEIQAVQTTTSVGRAPELPQTVKVTYEDGSSVWLNVTWEDIDAASYAQVGMFTVEGIIAGVDGTAKCNVTVAPAVIKEDFESFNGDIWKADEQTTILSGENQAVQISSSGTNGILQTKSEYPLLECRFDFMFEQDITSYEGLSVSFYRNDAQQTIDRFSVNPAWSNAQLRVYYQISGNSADLDENGCAKNISSQTWYRARFAYEDGKVYGKVWKADEAEPAAWDVRRTAEPGVGKLSFEFYAMTQKAMEIDNIVIKMKKTAMVTASPSEGTYSGSQQVTLSSAAENATIYYTTDGSTPTRASASYSAPIAVAQTMTIKAMAVSEDYARSDISTFEYEIYEKEVPGVDKSALEKAVADAKAIDTMDYTEKSVAALNEALKAAEAVLADEKADQAAVSDVMAALGIAVNGLEKVADKPTDPEKPTDPKTGDTASPMLWFGLLLGIAALAGAALICRRRIQDVR